MRIDISDQIPTNLGGGTESTFLLVDYGHVVVGDAMTIQIAISDSATYPDSAGNLQSAFSQDAVVLRTIALHDVCLRQDEAVQVLTGVTW